MADDSPVKVFISYAHEDHEWLSKLRKSLTVLEKDEQLIQIWDDGELIPGQQWNQQILTHLREAEMVLLLISSDFLASDYIRRTEIEEAVQRFEAAKSSILLIILRSCYWQKKRFGRIECGELEAMPKGERNQLIPMAKWSDPDEAFTTVVEGIKRAVENLRRQRRVTEGQPTLARAAVGGTVSPIQQPPQTAQPALQTNQLPVEQRPYDPPHREEITELLRELIYQEGADSSRLDPESVEWLIAEEISIYGRMRRDLENRGITITELEVARIRIEHSLLGEQRAPRRTAKGEPVSAKRYSKFVRQLEHLIREGRKTFVVRNCFRVQQKTDRIRRYLEKLWELGIVARSEDVECLCSVRILEGFVAPLYLLGGPLRKFDEDWPRISDEYAISLADYSQRKRLSDGLIMQSLLSSNFATWIAWGPSIPICQCEQWQYRQPGVRTTLQYGFGDENNSLPLLIPDVTEEECFDRIFGEREYRYHEIIVRKAEVIAKPSLLAERTRNGLARAICLGRDAESELVLNLHSVADIKVTGSPVRSRDGRVTKSIGYYTAYVWLLFGVTEGDPAQFTELFSPRAKHEREYKYAWRRLLPFFEHINLADPLAYKVQRRLLVYKALQFIKEYHEASGRSPINFVYLCAFDHPNCGVNGLIYDAPPEEETILGILRHSLAEDDSYQEMREHIHIQTDGKHAGYASACHLSALVERLNEHLRSLTDGDRNRAG